MEFGLRNVSFAYPQGGPDLWSNRCDHVLRAEADGWTELRVTFTGRFFQTAETILEPKPLQKLYPPI